MYNKSRLKSIYIFKTIFWLVLIATIIIAIVLYAKSEDTRILIVFGGIDVVMIVVKTSIDSYLEHCHIKYKSSGKERAVRELAERKKYR